MFAEDLAIFFNTDEFADEATLAGADVSVIFHKDYVVSGSGMGFTSTRPAIALPASAIGTNPVGQVVVHADVTYKVAAIDATGSGRLVTVLLLETT